MAHFQDLVPRSPFRPRSGRIAFDEPGGRGFPSTPFFQQGGVPGPFVGTPSRNAVFDEPGGRGFPATPFTPSGGTPGPFTGDTSVQGQGLSSSEELRRDPTRAFFGALDRTDLSPNQTTFFRSQRQNIFNRFLGRRDTQLKDDPDAEPLTFQNFIKDFDFQREFQNIPPQQRFGGGNRFNQAVRFFN